LFNQSQELTHFGRFLEPAILILVSLAEGPKHGYAMLEDIEQLWAVRLGPGTLYGALTRMEREGLIVALPSMDRRRPYQLTAIGLEMLRTSLNRLQALTAIGLHRLAYP
jgi:DNA-binding PadR family transcriptional regulator